MKINQTMLANAASQTDAIDGIESIDDNRLAAVTGGRFSPKNLAKTWTNALVNTWNGVLPEKVTLGGGPVPASADYNIPQIPKPFKDDPRSKIFS